MALIVRNDEQIKVGTTPGLITGSSFFTFDGTDGKKDYRQMEIVPSELNGRGILIRDVDYSWNPTTGRFDLLLLNDVLRVDQVYNIHFQPLAQPLTYDHTSLVNSSFFIRDITLPNIIGSSQGTLAVLERLNSFIAKYEAECLRKIMGNTMYNLLLTENSQRMTDLMYGTGYYSGAQFERYWEGLVHDTDISLIANYIYFYFQKANAMQTTGTGTKVAKAEAGESSPVVDKQIAAWKFFASETRAMCHFLWNKTVDDDNKTRVYPEFTADQWHYTMNFARPAGVNKFGF